MLLIFFCSGRLPDSSELLTKEDIVKVKRCIYALQRDGLPPITTHNVVSKLSHDQLMILQESKKKYYKIQNSHHLHYFPLKGR